MDATVQATVQAHGRNGLLLRPAKRLAHGTIRTIRTSKKTMGRGWCWLLRRRGWRCAMVGITVAGVTGEEGKVVRGKYPLIQLETGGLEELDVVVATGRP